MNTQTSTHPGALKEGFLVKKGKRHQWKSRWFVLLEDRLMCYRKKDRHTPVSYIKLKGASILSPVPDYDKREAVFKLSTRVGKEYLFEAPTPPERDVWTHSISAAIRSYDSTAQKDQSAAAAGQLATTMDLSDLLGAMQDPDAGVAMTTGEVDGAEHKNCFSGRAVVDWLVKWSFAPTRPDCVQLMDELLRLVHMHPIQVIGRSKSDVTPELANRKFYDSEDFFYRFSSITRTPSQDLLMFDSSSEDSDSSDGEQSEDDLDEGRLGKGKVIKEGFLMKRGRNLRKKWKMRKVLLRGDPTSIEYYSATKGGKIPLKLLSLDGCRVQAADREVMAAELLSIAPKRKKHVFIISKPGGKVIVFQAEDDLQRQDWITVLGKVCQQREPTPGPAMDNEQCDCMEIQNWKYKKLE